MRDSKVNPLFKRIPQPWRGVLSPRFRQTEEQGKKTKIEEEIQVLLNIDNQNDCSNKTASAKKSYSKKLMHSKCKTIAFLSENTIGYFSNTIKRVRLQKQKKHNPAFRRMLEFIGKSDGQEYALMSAYLRKKVRLAGCPLTVIDFSKTATGFAKMQRVRRKNK